MSNPRRDVVLIGAGPAGSVAALLLARRGWDVTLVEQHRFPRDKVCGECLSALGMEVLDRHGLGGRVRDAGAVPLTHSVAHSAGGRSLRLSLPRRMWGLSRLAFDQLLLDAAREAGVVVRQPARCESVESNAERSGSGVSVRLRDLTTNAVQTLHPTHVIVADGKAAVCGGAPGATGDFGIKNHFENVDAPPGCIELFGTCGTYGGLAPIERNRWNAAFSVSARMLRGSHGDLDGVFARLTDGNPLLRARLRGSRRVGPWLASPLPRFPVARAWPRNVTPVGNAAAAIEPIGGEGMGLAIRSAELAADALAGAAEVGRPHDAIKLAQRYDSLWRSRRHACRAAGQVVSRPATAAAAFSLARASPLLTKFALRLIGKRNG
jgi:2-polyprenyl-6-methoxyphenol hydroxylase-like FAD-dependent oxidoreductase